MNNLFERRAGPWLPPAVLVPPRHLWESEKRKPSCVPPMPLCFCVHVCVHVWVSMHVCAPVCAHMCVCLCVPRCEELQAPLAVWQRCGWGPAWPLLAFQRPACLAVAQSRCADLHVVAHSAEGARPGDQGATRVGSGDARLARRRHRLAEPSQGGEPTRGPFLLF